MAKGRIFRGTSFLFDIVELMYRTIKYIYAVLCLSHKTQIRFDTKGDSAMTKQEAKVYIQYIKVLLDIKGYTEKELDEALDMADYALDPEPVVKDPRFEWI